jgi:uncharacterized protein
MNAQELPSRPASVAAPLGIGIGWREELAGFIARRHGLGFVEVVAEGVHADRPLPAGLEELQRRLPMIPHGVKLSLGGAEKPDPARVAHLAAVADRLGAPLVSEHVAFVRAGGLEAGHLLPVPRTRRRWRCWPPTSGWPRRTFPFLSPLSMSPPCWSGQRPSWTKPRS